MIRLKDMPGKGNNEHAHTHEPGKRLEVDPTGINHDKENPENKDRCPQIRLFKNKCKTEHH